MKLCLADIAGSATSDALATLTSAGRVLDVAAAHFRTAGEVVTIRLGCFRGSSTGARCCRVAASGLTWTRSAAGALFTGLGVDAAGFARDTLVSEFAGNDVGAAKPTDKVALTSGFGSDGEDQDVSASACTARDRKANLTIAGVVVLVIVSLSV
jgi:hypothetical protein